MKLTTTLMFTFFISLTALAQPPRITILSTMVANYSGTGEWGFSALLESDSESILFDTGFRKDTVLKNASRLGKDLSRVEKVILTHFHTDHTGGLVALRKAFQGTNPKAFTTVYVGEGFFEQRYSASGDEIYSLPNQPESPFFSTAAAFREDAEAAGIRFIVVASPTEIAENMVLTGPIERVHDERNVSPGFFLKRNGTLIADSIPESQSVGIKTDKGWVLLSGCGHAGIVNAAQKLKKIEDLPVHLGIGGFHLFRASDTQVSWTASKLKEFGLKAMIGAHCTGAHATFQIAEALNLQRSDVSIGAVGTRVDEELVIHRASID